MDSDSLLFPVLIRGQGQAKQALAGMQEPLPITQVSPLSPMVEAEGGGTHTPQIG